MITRAQLDENWNSVRHAVEARWPILGGEELEEARGSAGHFVGLIQQRTGEDRQTVEHYLDSILSPYGSLVRRTITVIEQSPVRASMAALGIGFLVGLVIESTLDRSRR